MAHCDLTLPVRPAFRVVRDVATIGAPLKVAYPLSYVFSERRDAERELVEIRRQHADAYIAEEARHEER